MIIIILINNFLKIEDFENLDSSSIHSSFIHSIGKKKNSSSMDIEGSQEGFAKIWSDLHQSPTEWAPLYDYSYLYLYLFIFLNLLFISLIFSFQISPKSFQ